jgi:5-methylcytosine-specific restriction protein B
VTVEQVPTFQNYMNPILAGLRALGGSAEIERLDARVCEDMNLPTTVTAVPHKPERPERSEVSYRMAWARTYLKYAGLLTNPSRGVWALTEQGAITAHVDEYALAARYATRAQSDPNADDPDSDRGDHGTVAQAPFDPALLSDLRAVHETLLARGDVLRPEQSEAFYRRFRERFGPEVLETLDGERLLAVMHARQTKDSLVYWLEFKDDDEFPAPRFGSIAGGSALKFGIYQDKEGAWWTGTAQRQVPLSLDQAIERVRRQRDELVSGCGVLTAFVDDKSDDYRTLQAKMTEVAPEVADTAWGHKYFSLLTPSILDDYHVLSYQQYHLIKLLQVPFSGRYANAGPLVRVARALGLSPNQLAAALNYRHGSPHAYWRVGTTDGAGESEWSRMRDGGFMAIGWTELGNLSSLSPTKAEKDALRDRMALAFPQAANVTTRKTQEVFNFVVNVNEGDVAVASQGSAVRGIGVVRGPYYFQEGDGPFGHRRRVEWIDVSEWTLPEKEGLLTTFLPLGKHKNNLVAIERRLQSRPDGARSPAQASGARPTPVLKDVPARVQAALDRKLQVILHGPPGTGKTHWADVTMSELVARSWFGKAAADLTGEERATIGRDKAVSFCTFHPAYGYEDFIEGYRPAKSDDGLAFRLEPGIFKDVCGRARRDSKRQYFVLIDEINRGDIPRIFGELLTLLEKDKRGRTVRLPLSREEFSVPDNVRVIGTMNTADRSIALLDAALRRRFAFIELMPDSRALDGAIVGGLPLGPWLRELNDRIVKQLGRDARNLQVGHAYLMEGSRAITDPARFLEVFRDDILPLLTEYCYESFETLAAILGAPLVMRGRAGTAARLVEFVDGQTLIQALLQSFEGLATAPETMAVEDPAEAPSSEESDDDEDAQSGET